MPPKRSNITDTDKKYTKSELEEISYIDLRKLAKSNDIKAVGKKDEIIQKLVEFYQNGVTGTVADDSSQEKAKKVTGKRKEREEEKQEEKQEDEEDENTQDEKVEPSKPPPKVSKKPSAASKKQKVDESNNSVSRKEKDEEDDDIETETNKTATTTTTTTTTSTTTAVSPDTNGADKIVGPFKQCDWEDKKWIRDGSVTFYIGEEINRSKIAGFDMDDTLVRTKSGKVHSQSADDWVWWNQCVPDNLRKLYKDGYQVVIVTNQGGIGHGPKFDQYKYSSITKKICILEKELGIPLIALAACADDENRKPNSIMWKKLYQFTDGKVRINESESFYCGDAAGRPDNWQPGKKKDFSNSDLGFALSSGVRFETPETHFLGEEHYKNASGGDAASALIPKAETTGNAFDGTITSKDFEIVVSCGFPASGKSTFARKYFGPAGYVIVNQDTLKTKDKCIKAAREALSAGKSVIIDNTNPTTDIRSEYIKLAKQFGAKARCLRFTTPRDLAEHLNYFRERTQGVAHISSMVYNMFNKNLVEPTTKEGFASVHEIKFILDLKDSDKQQYFIPNPKAKAK